MVVLFGLLIGFIGYPILSEAIADDWVFDGIVWIIYPLGDFIIIAVLSIISLKFIKAPVRVPWIHLAIGFLCTTIADISYVIQELYMDNYWDITFNPWDIVYLAGYCIMAVAGLAMINNLRKLPTKTK